MIPADPQFDARVRANFDKQIIMATLGITLKDVTPGGVVLEMPFRDDLIQQHGFIHAGIITTALDSACGYAAFSLMPPEAEVLTVEFKSNFLRPAAGERFRFEGKVLKPGKTLMVTEGSAFAVTAAGEKLISSMQATMMVITGRDGINA
ncbi:MAG: PaaI family thioesterase [Pseudomonadota bacterium]